MSKKQNRNPEAVVEETPVVLEESVEETPVVLEESIEETEVEEAQVAPKTIYGTVVNCSMVNVRKEPKKDAEVVATIKRNSTVVIDQEASSNDFYKVCTASGIEGFCMKEFIFAQE